MKQYKILLLIITGILSLGLLGYLSIKLMLPSSIYTITSWWRTPSHNEEVGGVSNSMHLIGLGYDVSPKPTQAELDKLWWFRTKIQGYARHVHLGWTG